MLERTNVPLGPLTTLRLGGPAARLTTAYDEDEVVDAVRRARGPLLVLGGGSNVVLPDEGFDGTVVRIASRGLRVTREDDGDGVLVEAAAGEDWDRLVAEGVGNGLVGVECLAGIPGLVGGTPIQNVGAYGQDVSTSVVGVRAYDRTTDRVETLTDLGFGYRWSRFKAVPDRWVVLAVTYRLVAGALGEPIRYPELAAALGVEVGARVPVGDVREVVLRLRRSKGMVLDDGDPDTVSAGSFFTNPLLAPTDAARLDGAPSYPQADGRVKVPAAWLIERAGFGKGAFDGPVGISTKHTLALVNRGGATTADLLRVARAVRDGVREKFGVELEPEPVLIGNRL
jgi:UDP-N-acetylmuramate dehydrogenase